MTNERAITTRLRWYRRSHRLAVIAALASTTWLAVACALPVRRPGAASAQSLSPRVPELSAPPSSIEPLVAKLAGSRLIRPAAAIAAVKDDGAAARLLKQLKLHAVTESDEKLVAYVGVEKGGIVQLKEGDDILEFTVERIAQGRVSLSLRGVLVELSYF